MSDLPGWKRSLGERLKIQFQGCDFRLRREAAKALLAGFTKTMSRPRPRQEFAMQRAHVSFVLLQKTTMSVTAARFTVWAAMNIASLMIAG